MPLQVEAAGERSLSGQEECVCVDATHVKSSGNTPEAASNFKRLRDCKPDDTCVSQQKKRRVSSSGGHGGRGQHREMAKDAATRMRAIAESSLEPEHLNEEFREQLSLHIQRAVIGDEDGDKPIHMAVVYEDSRLVRWLCRLMHTVGAPIDSFNYMRQTPLHLAIAVGSAPLVKVLLEEGASPFIRDRHGSSVLHLAVKNGSEACLEELLRKCHATSAHATLLDALDREGFTPLHVAVLNSRTSTAQHLIRAGCNVNAQDGRSGRTPLFYAITNSNSSMVDLLVAAGASPDIPDYGGMTPLGKTCALNVEDDFD